MAYLKPPWFTRAIFNKVAMATGIGGSETLTVTRRVSKQPQQIPVVVPEVDGVKYLVSTRGETEWVKNVRAIPEVMVGDQKYVASEIPVEQRGPVIAFGPRPARSSRAIGASFLRTPITLSSR
jgi:hypothetical protein